MDFDIKFTKKRKMNQNTHVFFMTEYSTYVWCVKTGVEKEERRLTIRNCTEGN